MTGKFALVFMTDPESAEIFKCSEIRKDGEKSLVKRASWPECECTVLRTGTKKALSALKVKTGGQVDLEAVPAEILTNRYQALLRRKKELDMSARDQHLQTVANDLLVNGPGPSVPGRSTLRLPKKRSAEELAALQDAMDNLPCLKTPDETVRDLYIKIGEEDVWMKGSTILMLQAYNQFNPSGLMLALLDRLVPTEISSNPAVSRSGERNTVALKKEIIAGCNVLVQNHCLQHKIIVDFSLGELVRNFLYARSHKAAKKVCSVAPSAAPSTAPSAAPSPTPSPPPSPTTSPPPSPPPSAAPSPAPSAASVDDHGHEHDHYHDQFNFEIPAALTLVPINSEDESFQRLQNMFL